MKKIIGVAPATLTLKENNSCLQDAYKLGNNYIKRVLEAGCVPVGLAPSDNWLTDEQLDMCGGFIVQGGVEICPYHIQIIHHAVTKGKKYLGICLGSQLIYVYFALKKWVEDTGYDGDIVKAICNCLDTNSVQLFVKAPKGHKSEFPSRGNEDEAKHDVNIVPNTLLHRVVGSDTMRISTFHNFATPENQSLLTVNAWSCMGGKVVEGTEYSDYILGVQGHPEIDNKLPKIFEFLAKDR